MFGFYSSYFKFFGLTIYYYGLIIAVAIGLGIFLACKNAKMRGMKSDDILIAVCYIVPIAIIGARIYYIIGAPDKFRDFVSMLKIWDGGIAILGAVIGGAIGVAIYCLIHKKNFLDVGDVVVPSLILGQALGRIGCYFSGCCYGIEVTNPKHMWFPFATIIGSKWHYSTFFYESIWNFIVFAVLMLLLRKFKLKQRGSISAFYLILYGFGRALIETIRGDSLMWGAIKASQLVSILMIFIGLAILIFFFVWNKCHPESKLKVEALYTKTQTTGKITIEKPREKSQKRKRKKQKTKKEQTDTLKSPDAEIIGNNEKR